MEAERTDGIRLTVHMEAKLLCGSVSSDIDHFEARRLLSFGMVGRRHRHNVPHYGCAPLGLRLRFGRWRSNFDRRCLHRESRQRPQHSGRLVVERLPGVVTGVTHRACSKGQSSLSRPRETGWTCRLRHQSWQRGDIQGQRRNDNFINDDIQAQSRACSGMGCSDARAPRATLRGDMHRSSTPGIRPAL